jgi:hypothetical protein
MLVQLQVRKAKKEKKKKKKKKKKKILPTNCVCSLLGTKRAQR